jgi:hypothetical protein
VRRGGHAVVVVPAALGPLAALDVIKQATTPLVVSELQKSLDDMY